jgi:hypothetical protein
VDNAALLEKIRQCSDAQERLKVMKEYHQANQTIHMLVDGKGDMMGGKSGA